MVIDRENTNATDVFDCIFQRCEESQSLQIQLATARLVIRSFELDHLPLSLELYGDSEITRFFDSGKAKTSEEVRQLVHREGVSYFARGIPWGIFSIFAKESGEFIGHIDLFPSDEPGFLEVGYILRKEAQGRGFCSEAALCLVYDYVPLLMKQGYRVHGRPIKGVVATVHPSNISSKNVLEKLGMTYQRSLIKFDQPRLLYMLSFPSSRQL